MFPSSAEAIRDQIERLILIMGSGQSDHEHLAAGLFPTLDRADELDPPPLRDNRRADRTGPNGFTLYKTCIRMTRAGFAHSDRRPQERTATNVDAET